jgi:hypothetical protein
VFVPERTGTLSTSVLATSAAHRTGGSRSGAGSITWAGFRIADFVLIAFLGMVAATRWFVLQPLALPPGADGGNWIAIGRSLVDHTAMPGGVVYPPAVPALALVADLLGKPIEGLKLIATVSSLVPAVGCYAAARICGVGWSALLPAAFLAVASSIGEAAAWGGYPQLIGLGLMAIALASFDRSFRTWRPGWATLCGIAFAATLATTHLIAAVTALAAVLLVCIHLILRTVPRPSPRGLVAVAGLVLVPSLPLIFVYVPLLQAVYQTLGTHGSAPANATTAMRDFPSHLYREIRAFWYAAQFVGATTPLLYFARRNTKLWPMATSMLAASGVLFVGLHEQRLGYVAPMAAMLGLAAWLDAMRTSIRPGIRVSAAMLAVALVPVLGYQSLAGYHWFRVQTSYYQVLTPDWVGALRYLREQTPSDAVVAVSSNGRLDPTGWWVQGLGRRQALIDTDLEWLNFPDERERTRQAIWIFDPAVSIQESLRRARSDGVAYLLIDKRWQYSQAWTEHTNELTVVDDSQTLMIVLV